MLQIGDAINLVYTCMFLILLVTALFHSSSQLNYVSSSIFFTTKRPGACPFFFLLSCSQNLFALDFCYDHYSRVVTGIGCGKKQACIGVSNSSSSRIRVYNQNSNRIRTGNRNSSSQRTGNDDRNTVTSSAPRFVNALGYGRAIQSA